MFSRTTYPHRLCHVVCIGNWFHAMKAHHIVYAFKSRQRVSNWKLDYEVKVNYIVNWYKIYPSWIYIALNILSERRVLFAFSESSILGSSVYIFLCPHILRCLSFLFTFDCNDANVQYRFHCTYSFQLRYMTLNRALMLKDRKLFAYQ